MTKLGLLAMLLGACTTVESDNILTSGMYADFSARADEGGTTTVSATLFLGNPLNLNFVDLTGDDELRASSPLAEKVMSETIILNIVSHTATFRSEAESAENCEYVIDFFREVDEGAPNSVVTLPAPFDMFGVDPTPTTASRAAELDLSWAPLGTDPMSWRASGECIESAGELMAIDEGGATIEAGTLRKRAGAQIADSCTVTVTVSRTREGQLDTNYGEGGSIVGEQVRSFTFTSTP